MRGVFGALVVLLGCWAAWGWIEYVRHLSLLMRLLLSVGISYVAALLFRDGWATYPYRVALLGSAMAVLAVVNTVEAYRRWRRGLS